MSWYQENRWLGNFLIVFAACLLFAVWLAFHARNEFLVASAIFNDAATERSRLEHLNPFPNEENFRKTQTALEGYRASLNKVKEELKAQIAPAAKLAPNEFQTRLRQAIIDVEESARANRVRFPENFHIGFDEFTTALPDTSASSSLGDELTRIQLLVSILIDNHVDAITSFKRLAPRIQPATISTPTAKPSDNTQQSGVGQREAVELAFDASPAALRNVLNQIASSRRQMFILRTLHIRNERQEAPVRDQGEGTASKDAAPNSAPSPAAIKFIVGNEHVRVEAIVELMRLNF